MTWRHFKLEEFACPCCGENHMKHATISRLDDARDDAGVAFVITSGYRCARYNASSRVRGATDSAHTRGFGADVSTPDSVTRYKILRALVGRGFNRIGIYPSHIHIDDDPSLFPGVCWHGG
jgi:zinc D-Ala-D-Ala carboxypeptidase